MKLIEGAMFKLALRGTITLSEAKILRALEEKFACSYQSLCSETGIEMGEILAASKRLLSKGIIKEHYGVYYTENIEEKILGLIEETEQQIAVVRPRK